MGNGMECSSTISLDEPQDVLFEVAEIVVDVPNNAAQPFPMKPLPRASMAAIHQPDCVGIASKTLPGRKHISIHARHFNLPFDILFFTA